MAELILSPIAELMIETLGSAAMEEIKSLRGVKRELGELENTLGTIRAVLLDAEKRQVREEHVRVWLERLEALFYDADDFVDEVAAEGLRRQLVPGKNIAKKVRTFFSASNQLVFRYKMASKIKDFRKRLALIAADRVGLHLVERREETKPVRRERETAPFILEENVVGRVRDKMAILELLFEAKNRSGHNQENVSVIPIVGMGGLGKTTLAQLLFKDDRVQEHFDLGIWVCVSDNFDKKLLIEKIIEVITSTSTENLRLEQLQKILLDKLYGKRYLLVLDDVWDEDPRKWIELKGLLMSNCVQGSKIIVTSRNEMVAKLMGTVQPYHLGMLGPEDSWALFKNVAFLHGQEPNNPTIVNIAKKILKQCGGVPLAITMIGSMLRFRNLEIDWPSFLEKDFSTITHDECGILSTLRLSYFYLPSHLKPCFAYCSLFPKDHIIEVKTLITLWIAQGFIKSDRSQCLEEIGYDYFMDLLWRSFFQEVKRDKYNKVKTCKMHDLNHDLATQIAGNTYGMLVSGEQVNFEKIRHLSFGFHLPSPEQLQTSVLQAKGLRAILFPVDKLIDILTGRQGESICNPIISSFKFLRMLDLHNLGIKKVPNSIGNLKHLRCLDLSRNKIETIPTSITKLVNLHTLKLNWCSRLCELPREVNKLVNLRHLEFHGYNRIAHMPKGLSQLTNLQTLTKFVMSDGAEGSKLEELKGLNNLRGELQIRGLRSWMETKAANLKGKQYLLSLHLDWCPCEDDALSNEKTETTVEDLQLHPNLRELTLLGYPGTEFSSWLPCLTNLVELCLRNCEKCQQLPSLYRFQSLKKMELANLPALRYITCNEEDSCLRLSSPETLSTLPSLQQLKLLELPNFEGWRRPGITKNQLQQVLLLSFPSLSASLEIKDCPKLTSMPLFPNVEKLSLENTSLKPFQLTACMSTTRVQTSATTSSSLSKLRELRLCGIVDPNLHYLPNWMKSLVALQKLYIRDYPTLRHLSPGIQYLTSLQNLSILDCEELDISNDVLAKWHALTNLRTLTLSNLPRLTTLPMRVRHITSLQVLALSGCNNLIAIPHWICNLSSLERLEIRDCPNLKSLPRSISTLSSLDVLLIKDCPSLIERCQYQTGEDWPMIAHIPHVFLRSTEDENEHSGSTEYLAINITAPYDGQTIYGVPEGYVVMLRREPFSIWSG